jgi:flagellar basal-body rod modification protein FlgD
MSSITSVTTTPNDQANSFLNPQTEVRTTGSKTLGVDDFLKLITVQLTSQDPLKPMEDTAFISQMASFTSLDQMQTLSKNFAAYSADQKAISAQNFLGKVVTIATSNGNITGPVTKVSFQDGEPLLSVNGGDFSTSDVISISAPAAAVTTTSNQSSNSTN